MLSVPGHTFFLRIYIGSFLICSAGYLVPALTGAEVDGRPNIVFIFADDLAYNTLGATDTQQPKTPHLDRLAREGTVFTHAYNQGGWHGAICVASRSMLNTGRFLWRAHEQANRLDQERIEGRLWSQYLKEAGYTTFFSGKWHLKANVEDAFDVVKHVRPGMPRDTPQSYNRPRANDPWKAWDKAQGGYWEEGQHWSEVLASDACDYLTKVAGPEKPFFMYLAFNAPHDPRQAPKHFLDLYPLEDIDLPDSFLSEYPYKDAIGCGEQLRDEKLGPFPRTPHAIKVHRQEYFAIISHLDAQIGRILNALDQAQLRENTLVIFSADHGLAVGNHGLLGKQNMFDHSVRVPFLLKGPGIRSGEKNSAPIYLQDIMPTTLELANVAVPEHVQFRSLLPILRMQREHNYDAIYAGYMQSQRMITKDGFKLILYPSIKKVLLYDLQSDPDEMHDLANEPEQKERLRTLFAKLLKLQEQTGDALDLRPFFPELS